MVGIKMQHYKAGYAAFESNEPRADDEDDLDWLDGWDQAEDDSRNRIAKARIWIQAYSNLFAGRQVGETVRILRSDLVRETGLKTCDTEGVILELSRHLPGTCTWNVSRSEDGDQLNFTRTT